jgi:hypothetical protein
VNPSYGSVGGPAVAASAAAAGFSGSALVTIVAIARRESGWDPDAIGDQGITDETWGPSVGAYQVRTLRAATGTGTDRDIQALMPGGRGDLDRQSLAAWAISGAGTNFAPWSTYAGLTDDDLAAASAAIGGTSLTGPSGAATATTTSVVGDAAKGILFDPMQRALLDFLGSPADSVNAWINEHIMRGLELAAGALLLAAATIFLADIVSGPADIHGQIGRAVARGRQLVQTVAMAAAA